MLYVPAFAPAADLTPFERAVDKLELAAPAPIVVQRALAIIADDRSSWRDLAKVLSADAGLVARIVRLASAPAFAARPVASLASALQVLGGNQLRQLVVAAQLAGRGSAFGRKVWAYSLRIAFTCQALAERRSVHGGPDPFLCGLLHDLGTMAFEGIVGPSYATMPFVPGDDQQCELERERFGFDHADLGAMVAARWNLFPELELVAQLHHTPAVCADLGIPAPSRIAIESVALARVLGAEAPSPERDRLCAALAIDVEAAEVCAKDGARAAAELLAELG